jgi:hypothetical protein
MTFEEIARFRRENIRSYRNQKNYKTSWAFIVLFISFLPGDAIQARYI